MRVKGTIGALLVAALSAWGCAADDELDESDDVAMWRIDLVGSADEAAVTSVERIGIDEAIGRPHPALDGSHLVIAYAADDEVIDAVPLYFPEHASLAQIDDGQVVGEEELAIPEAPSTVFVPVSDEIDRIEVVHRSGDTHDLVTTDDLPEETFRTSPLLGQRYAHIAFLEAGEEDRLPSILFKKGYVDSIYTPTQEQATKLLAGLDNLAEGTASSVVTLAIVDMPDKGCKPIDPACERPPDAPPHICDQLGIEFYENGVKQPTGITAAAAVGATIIVNRHWLDLKPAARSAYAVTHEITHCLNNLLDATASSGTDKWPPKARAAAIKTFEKYLHGDKLTSAWKRIHATAVDVEVASDYVGKKWCDQSKSQAIQRGFATPYGGATAKEDIAEYAAQVQAYGAEAEVCRAFADAPGKPGPEVAIQYAKVAFLRALGAISQQRFGECTNGIALDGPPGIHLGDAISFTSSTAAKQYEDDGVPYFGFGGDGPNSYQILVRVRNGPEASPIGLHRLDSIHAFNIKTAENGAYLAHANPLRVRASGGGLVLITDATESGAKGAIFFLTMQNAFGYDTDQFAVSTFEIGDL